MALDTLLESVEAQSSSRAQARLEDYDKLVTTLARKPATAPSAEEIADLLEEAGKTASDLKADIELLIKRDGWSAQLNDEPKLQAERDALVSELSALQTGFSDTVARLRRELGEKCAPKQQRLSQLQTKLNDVTTARNRLAETSPTYREVLRLYNERGKLLREVEGGLSREKRQAEALANKLRGEVADKTLAVNGAGGRSVDLPGAKRELAKAEVELARVDGQIKRRTDEAAQLKQRIDELEAEAQKAS